MAIDLFSENPSPVGMSPRISFSYDLSQSDINFPVEQRRLRSISSSTASVDFDFCIHQSFNQESTSAEELFSNGKILPTQVKEKIFTPKSIPPSAPPPAPPHDHHGAVNSTKNNSENDSNETTKYATGSDQSNCHKQKSKSFWQFKRSSSLNCSNGYARSLCPLPPLLRSNSTGSSSSSKRSSSSKDGLNHKQHSQKTPLVVCTPVKHSQFSSSNSYQKPPIKKNGYGPPHGNGTVRINPVLNVPSANLFGLGSIFSSNKEMKNKKK